MRALRLSIQPRAGRGAAGGRERVPTARVRCSATRRSTPAPSKDGCSTVAPSVKRATWCAAWNSSRRPSATRAEVFGPSSRMVGFFSLPLADAPAGDRPGRRRARQRPHGRRHHRASRQARVVPVRGRHPSARRRAPRGSPRRRGAARSDARRRDAAADAPGRARGHPLVPGRPRARPGSGRADIARRRICSRRSCPHPGPPSGRSEIKALYAMGVAKRLAGDPSGALRFQQQALQSTAHGRGAELRRMRVLTEVGLALLDLAQTGPGDDLPRASAPAFPATADRDVSGPD